VSVEPTSPASATRSAAADPLVRQLREQISDLDRAIVDLVNRRLELVTRIRRRKEELGMPFLDPAREEWILRYLTRANRGPLSAEGLAELHAELLALTKRELEAWSAT
jgi:chorismate mutase